MKPRIPLARALTAAAAALLIIALLAGCKPKIADKMMVQIAYKGTLADGSVFDTSEGGEPLEFLYGVGMMIPGLETGLKGLKVGEKKSILVAAADAYGDRDETAIQEVPRDQFPDDMDLEVGMPLSAQTEQGMMYATVTEIREKVVVMDFNHPLAGKDLTFDIEVLKIRRATKEELAQLEGMAP